MSRINEEEAAQTLEILRELGEVQAELEAMRDSEGGSGVNAPRGGGTS
jgi:hydrogenase expression/formation protein HypC